MKRREFLKKGLLSGAAAGSALMFGKIGSAHAASTTPSGKFDLVALKGREPEKMFDAGIKSLGGMREFVKKGQIVVVKPNIGWDYGPERAATTHPGLVGRIVEQCIGAGAKKVYVLDNTCDKWKRCYERTGIEKVAGDAGAIVVPAFREENYQKVDISKGTRLKTAKVHELILEADVNINVPVLKHHTSTKLTIAMKNLMGVVWDRRFWHKNDLHQCVADFVTYFKPTLNVIDAYRVLTRNGPRGTSAADVVKMNSQIISTDIVAADAAAAKIFGLEPEDIGYIVLGDELGLGTKDLKKLAIKRIKM